VESSVYEVICDGLSTGQIWNTSVTGMSSPPVVPVTSVALGWASMVRPSFAFAKNGALASVAHTPSLAGFVGVVGVAVIADAGPATRTEKPRATATTTATRLRAPLRISTVFPP